MALSITQFNESLPEFNELLKDNLCGYVKGSCRRTHSNPVLGDELHIYGTIYIQDTLVVNFTIRYDKFHNVPVLYFNVFEGLQDPIPIQDFDKLSRKYVSVISEDAAGATSLEMNPVNNLVSFFVHPCETNATLSEWDGLDAAEKNSGIRYLIVWFNLYGLSRIFPAAKFRPVK
ncbi:ubiquitin-like-conjugating enzyme Atg10p [[Candida] railenensis]|uniref:Ubiquitin-like-conjugating enzyme Atg10p n=1 Tax=[Candida] railenensis TaxID=45579 RepID=A0A9P0QV73_9ASCO|nr:ubiquitin-like-conjugating enzyme Atg10p [[Candida] railenensis]